MEITLFSGAKCVTPQNYQVSWSELCSLASEMMRQERHRSDKLRHDAMIFGRCEGKRANSNVRFLSGLAADFDLAPSDSSYLSFDDRCAELERQGLAFIAYTTTKNDHPHNKYRLLLPYERDVPAAHCRAAWHAGNAKLGSAIDKSTKDPARLSFLPASWTGNPFIDAQHGKLRLVAPFEAIRINASGAPILSTTELDPLARLLPDVCAIAKPPVALCKASMKTLTPRVTTNDDPVWLLLADLERSPLVRQWMLTQLPNEEGNRDYRFMKGVAGYAVQHGFAINAEAIELLAEQFSRTYLNRLPPPDTGRQAENALTWAFNEFGAKAPNPRQPDAGTQP